MSTIDNLERMLGAGRDSALLRFSLGSEYLKVDQPARAAEHFARAVAQDPEYSAAWKLYGKALAAAGQRSVAAEAFVHGIEVAGRRGDKQAAKEMQVFLRRVRKQLEQGE